MAMMTTRSPGMAPQDCKNSNLPLLSSSMLTSSSPELSASRRQASYELNVSYKAAGEGKWAKTNCHAIEMPVFLPLRPDRRIVASSLSISRLASASEKVDGDISQGQKWLAEYQGKDGNAAGKHSGAKETFFPFFSLPAELRLRIYALLLPPRIHKIASQYPHNGAYYSFAAQAPFASRSLYQAAICAAPTSAVPCLTTYTILSANLCGDSPSPNIHPQILRACHRARAEAEPLLYGASGVVFDFGSYWPDALAPFWTDRSPIARACVKRIALTWDISAASEAMSPPPTMMQQRMKICAFFKEKLPALRSVDLSIFAADLKAASAVNTILAPATPGAAGSILHSRRGPRHRLVATELDAPCPPKRGCEGVGVAGKVRFRANVVG